jgi:hypothetical protein
MNGGTAITLEHYGPEHRPVRKPSVGREDRLRTGILNEDCHMKNARQFVYRYAGDAKTDEVIQDLDGQIPVPGNWDFIMRRGKKWKAIKVISEQLQSNPPAIPVHRVFLTNAN